MVDDEGRRRLETLEHSLDRRAHHAGSRPRLWAQLDAVADDRQLPKVVQIVLAQAQRLGQGGQHLRRRVGVASLLDADQVVDADTGQGGQLGSPQAGRAPPRPVG